MNKWDNYFLNIARETAKLSKDPNTKVGVCIASKDNKVLTTGYNGAPRCFDDSLVPAGNTGELITSKNTFMCHAEINAILNYGGRLSDFKEAVVYTTVSPCCDCAKYLAQVGIKKIIFENSYSNEAINNATSHILKNCDIELLSVHNL